MVLGFLGLGAAPGIAATVRWVNPAGGEWSVPANWSPAQVPGVGDTAVVAAVGSYTVTLSGGASVGGLTLGGGGSQPFLRTSGGKVAVTGAARVEVGATWEIANELECPAGLVVQGAVRWLAGAVRGSVALAAGGELVLDGGSLQLVGSLTNAGTVEWLSGRFYLEDGTTFRNQAGGTLEIHTDNALDVFGAGPNLFINEGRVIRFGGVGATDVMAEFDNRGTVEVRAGVLAFPRGFTSRGSFTVSEGARVALRGGVSVFEPGHAFSGAGAYGVDSGTVRIEGDIADANFQLVGGILDSTNRIVGTLAWTGGFLRGGYTVAPGAVLRLEGGSHQLVGSLTNAGTVEWLSGRFYLEEGTTFRNLAGGTLEIHTDNALDVFGAEPNLFINEGRVIRFGGAGSTEIMAGFDNRGTVEVRAGVLSFPRGFTSRGTFAVSEGARVALRGGVSVFEPGHAFSGTGAYGVDSGTVGIQGDIADANFQLAGGILDSTNRIVGTLVWTGGFLRGGYTVAPGAALRLEGGSRQFVGSLTNAGTVEWLSGRFYLEEGSTFRNQAGGTLEIRSDGALDVFGAGPNLFINEGRVIRFGGTGSTEVMAEFDNRGTVEVRVGVLSFPRGFTSRGTFAVSEGARVALRGGVSVFEPGHGFSGAGAYGVDSGTVGIQGDIADANFQLVGGILDSTNRIVGTLAWTGGFLRGGYTVAPGAVLRLEGGSREFVGSLTNAGTVEWLSGRFYLEEGSTFLNRAGGLFTIESENALDSFGEGPNRLLNQGRIVLSGGVGATEIRVEFENSGDLDIGQRGLRFSGGFVQTGGSTRLAGGPLSSDRPIQIRGGLLAGSGIIFGSVTNSGEVQVGGSPGRLEIRGDYTQTPTGTLDVELAGTGAGAFDQLDVSGAAQLAGRLRTAFLGGFAPPVQTLYAVVTAASRTGVFGTHDYPTNRAGLQLEYAGTSVTVRSLEVLAGDQVGPRVVSMTPSGGVSAAPSRLDVVFDSPLDPASVGPGDIVLRGPSGVVAAEAVAVGETGLQLQFPPLPPGEYTVEVGPGIADQAGNLMDQDGDGTNGESVQDRFTGSLSFLVPDLLVLAPVGPAEALPGQSIEVRWAVTNRGNATALGPWSETVAFTNSPALAILRFTNSLAPGAGLVRTQRVEVPLTGMAGILRLGIEVDSLQEIAESDERNNVAVAAAATSVPGRLALAFAADTVAEDVAGGRIAGSVSRNGDLSSPLVVGLVSDDTSELRVPVGVTIPAGQVAVAFEAEVVADGVVDGPGLATVTASAPGFPPSLAAVTVLNIDRPGLRLAWADAFLTESGSGQGTVTRDLVTGDAVEVRLTVSDDAQITVPERVVLPANQASATFIVRALDDTLIETPAVYRVGAVAPGFRPGETTVEVRDDDIPQMTLSLSPTEVSEGAGARASVGTVTRDAVGPRALVVELESADETVARVPSRVTLPAGVLSVSFPVAAVDNDRVEGLRRVALGAFGIDTAGAVRLAAATPETLTVLDDDGPTLRLRLDRDLVGEGRAPAATATVTRNAGIGVTLVVTVVSSDPTEATVPATVTLPAGQASVTFPVTSVDDGTPDGDQTVSLSVTAAGFTGGGAVLVVSDRDVPDLVVASVVVPATGSTEASVPVTVRVVNQGGASTGAGTVQRVFLSPDPAIGDDTLVGQADFNPSLGAGLRFDQTLNVRLPRAPGTYWVVAVTDAGGAVPEILEDNNATLSTHPIVVGKTYGATVSTDFESGPAGTAVPLAGRATLTEGGGPAPFVPVTVHLEVRGVRRLISAITDGEGRYATTFVPLPGEAGTYRVGADHPGLAATPVQDVFTLSGVRLTAPGGPITVVEGRTTTGSLSLENLSDLSIGGLAASVVGQPANLQVGVTLTNRLEGGAVAELGFTLLARDASVREGLVRIRVTGTGGVAAEVDLPVVLELLRPRLVVDPVLLEVGMLRGSQTSVPFRVSNVGGAASGEIAVLPPALDWIGVATGSRIPSLAPGEETQVTLVLTPPAELALGDHEGSIGMESASVGAGVTLPFRFRALSSASGGVRITAVDEYTYYAEGSPNVTNATVTVTDAASGLVVAGGVTDGRGEFSMEDLREAYYRIEVRADGHASFRTTQLLAAGRTTEVLAFLNRETVKYVWKVVPTEIEDRTKIVIEAVFETVVPFPVVTVEPMYVDLADFPGDEVQIDFKITNHGLVAANNARIEFETHPEVVATPLIGDLGTLAARSSVTVPVLVKRLPSPGGGGAGLQDGRRGPRLAAGAAACNLNGQTLYDAICGPVKRDYRVPISLGGAGRCSLGSGEVPGGTGGFGGLLGGGGGVGPGFGGARGGAYTAPVYVNDDAPCNLCPLQALAAGLNCAKSFLAADASKCAEGVYKCFSGEPGGKTLYKCMKGFYSCAKVAGSVIPGAGAVSNLKYLECAYGMLTACNGSAAALAGGDVTQPELEPLRLHAERLQMTVDVDLHLFGSPVWFEDQTGATAAWLGAFVAAAEDASVEGPRVSAAERAVLKAGPLPVTVTGADVDRFLDRWNRSLEYAARGIFNAADVPAGESLEFIDQGVLRALAEKADEAAQLSAAEGFESPVAGLEAARQDLVRFYQSGSDGDCATIRLRLEQQAVITRDAFDASLEIVNGTGGPLENIQVDLVVQREDGTSATDLFGIRPGAGGGIGAVDGTGSIAAGTTGRANWILIPTSEAAPEGPTVMRVSGRLRYRQGGTQIDLPLSQVAITVFPNASLRVKYFHQRDVFSDDPFTDEIEPSIPYSLGVLIENRGRGAARNVRIASAQPKIIENEKGLLIDFEIIATEVAGQNQTPSLTAAFGDIGPGAVGVGRWLLRSSLQGLFIDYQASFEHLDGLGDKRLSLIEGVEIHEMTRVVRAGGAFEDGRFDFLANDVPDLGDLPDTLHLSDGRVEPVFLAGGGVVDGPAFDGHLEVRLTAVMPAGWAYLRLPDPGDGGFKLARVRRADGTELPLDLNVWTTDRTFIGQGRRPVRENLLHLLDHNSAGSYTLEYLTPPSVDGTAPTSAVAGLPASSFPEFGVRWSGADTGGGVAFFDVFVSVDGGPFAPWLERTTLTGALYDGEPGRRYAFASVATDAAGNREAGPAAGDAETVVSLANTAPVLDLAAELSVDEGEILTLQVRATDGDVPANLLTFGLGSGVPAGVVMDPRSGALTWVTGEGTGPGTNVIAVRVTDNGTPSLGGTGVVRVVVREVNQAPVLDPVPGRTVNEGARVRFTATATDADLPANRLRYQLGTGAPAGAVISPDGVFDWTPSARQGPSTNLIPIVVTDDGVPALSGTGTVRVVVRDALGDFIVEVGVTNLFAGDSGGVPIRLTSGVDLVRLTCVLEVSEANLANLALEPLAPEIGLASLRRLAPDRFELQLTAAMGEILQGNRTVARLTFDAVGESATVPLHWAQVGGERASGEPLDRPTARDGRVIIVLQPPVLEASPLDPTTLTLYGRAGRTYVLEYAVNLGPDTVWTPLKEVEATRSAQKITGLRSDLPVAFYRVRQSAAAAASALQGSGAGARR